MKPIDYILNNEQEVLTFLRSRYPIYHLSNVFFRDIQYGITAFLDRKDIHVSYKEAERIARAFVAQLERKWVLVQMDPQTWAVHNPAFKTPPAKPAGVQSPSAPAKPAGVVSPTSKPALPPLSRPLAASPSTARPSLPPLNRPPAVKIPAAASAPQSATVTSTIEPAGQPTGGSLENPGVISKESSPAQQSDQPEADRPQAEVKKSTATPPRPLPPIKSSRPARTRK